MHSTSQDTIIYHQCSWILYKHIPHYIVSFSYYYKFKIINNSLTSTIEQSISIIYIRILLLLLLLLLLKVVVVNSFMQIIYGLQTLAYCIDLLFYILYFCCLFLLLLLLLGQLSN